MTARVKVRQPRLWGPAKPTKPRRRPPRDGLTWSCHRCGEIFISWAACERHGHDAYGGSSARFDLNLTVDV